MHVHLKVLLRAFSIGLGVPGSISVPISISFHFCLHFPPVLVNVDCPSLFFYFCSFALLLVFIFQLLQQFFYSVNEAVIFNMPQPFTVEATDVKAMVSEVFGAFIVPTLFLILFLAFVQRWQRLSLPFISTCSLVTSTSLGDLVSLLDLIFLVGG